jgi:CheY-like chemotaxis protein
MHDGTTQSRKIPGFVYSITDKGHELLIRSGAELPQIEQELLIRIDGRTTSEQLILDVAHAGEIAIERTLDRLTKRGLIEKSNLRVPDDNSLDFTASFEKPARKTSLSPAKKAGLRLEAVRGASQLAQNGYYISITRQASTNRPPRNGEKHSLLIIEDDPMTAKLLNLLFAGEGFEVATAGNRKEILSALSQKPLPDAVLLDVALPDVNGFDLLAKMRAHPALRNMPVVMLTAAASRDDVLQGLLNGADGYITKPFDIERVVGAVCDVLGIQRWSVSQ